MNYYEILEVSSAASPETIKAAYKSLMQRNHPDKNPGNVRAAQIAIQITEAYEVLADPNRRIAYDVELGQLAQLRDARKRTADAPGRPPAVADSGGLYLYLGLPLACIILFGWFAWSPAKKQQSPESALMETRLAYKGKQLTREQLQARTARLEEIFAENPSLRKAYEAESASDRESRTIALYITNLSVELKAPDAIEPPHTLSIPAVSTVTGTFDSDKFTRHLKSNNEFISRKLAEALVNAKYDALAKAGGNGYLKKFILDSLGEITGANRLEEYPSTYTEAPGRYGVIDVSFPESFEVK